MPDWVFEKPERSNETFLYKIVGAVGDTETEARNNAYTNAFVGAALQLDRPYNISDIKEAIISGTDVKQLSQKFAIPLNVVCYYIFRTKKGEWICQLLCQIPETEYINNAQFEDFNDCDKHERYDQMQKKLAAKSKQTNLGIHEDVDENESITTILRDGQICILFGEKTYTLTGQEVK